MYKVLRKRTLFRDNVIGIRMDTVKAPDGMILHRRVLEYKAACAVVGFSNSNRILLVRHFRYPINRHIWELPGGILEENEATDDCAKRELREEAGYIAEHIEPLTSFFPEPTFSNQVLHLFIAHELKPVSDRLEELEIGTVQFFTSDEVLQMVESREIISSWSIVGVLLALRCQYPSKLSHES